MRKFILAAIVFAIFAIAFVSGCIPEEIAKEDEAKGIEQIPTKQALVDECEAACRAAVAEGQDLSNGPCLLDPMSDSDWVCDIAHDPRENVDNLRENQCNAWHNKTASHFIEFTPDCNFIKAY